MKFPFYKQPDAMDCGPCYLKIITSYYDKEYSIDILRRNTFIVKDGVSLMSISRTAETIGFKTIGGALLSTNW
jgi:ATP-binding cassette subfamily B protein